METKVFDSETTDKGTRRKRLYIKSLSDKKYEAMLQARRDISEEARRLRSEEKQNKIKPFKRRLRTTSRDGDREIALTREEHEDALAQGYVLTHQYK